MFHTNSFSATFSDPGALVCYANINLSSHNSALFWFTLHVFLSSFFLGGIPPFGNFLHFLYLFRSDYYHTLLFKSTFIMLSSIPFTHLHLNLIVSFFPFPYCITRHCFLLTFLWKWNINFPFKRWHAIFPQIQWKSLLKMQQLNSFFSLSSAACCPCGANDWFSSTQNFNSFFPHFLLPSVRLYQRIFLLFFRQNIFTHLSNKIFNEISSFVCLDSLLFYTICFSMHTLIPCHIRNSCYCPQLWFYLTFIFSCTCSSSLSATLSNKRNQFDSFFCTMLNSSFL